MSPDGLSALIKQRPKPDDSAHRTARLVGENLAAVVGCSGWLSLDVASRERLVQRGVISPELLELAAREARRPRQDESPRRLRAGGVYGDVLGLRVDAPGELRLLVLLARLGDEPKFSAANVSEAQAKAERIQLRLQRAAVKVDESLPSIRRRSRIGALIVSRSLQLICMSLADDRLAILEDRFPPRLPREIEAAVRGAIATWPADFADGADEIFVPVGGAVARIVPMLGENGYCIGVFLEGARPASQIEVAAAGFCISKRELEVARLLIKGLQAEDVARELGIAEGTVAAHVRSIMLKSGSRNRTEAIAKLLAT